MSRIRFISLRADKLILGAAIIILILAVTGYLILLRLVGQDSTPIPRAVLWHSLPASTQESPPASTFAIGAPAPDFTLATTSGDSATLSSYQGSPLILYFWASWCTFCRDDMPQLEQVSKDNKEAGLVILAINLLEKPELVRSFAQQLHLNLPLLLDQEGTASATYLIKATPTYIFIDRDGVVRAQVVGRPRPQVFERNLQMILPTQEPPPVEEQA